MNRTKLIGLGLLMAVLAAAGGGLTTAQDKKDAKKDDHDHGPGPNGGVIFDLGKYHAEIKIDHAKKECAVLFLDGDDAKAKPLAVAVGELILTTKPTKVKEGADKGKDVAAMTIELKAVDAKNGKAAKYVGTAPGLANVAAFEGTVAGEIGGKPSSGKFKE